MPTPIVESILADSAGRHIRFRWHLPPCPDNSMVAIFEYLADGSYIHSDYIARSSARARWRKLISDGWFLLRTSKSY